MVWCRSVPTGSYILVPCPNPPCIELRDQNGKYLKLIERNEKKHDKEIQVLDKEIEILKSDVKVLKNDMAKLIGENLTRRSRMLGGSIAFAFLDRLNKFVFQDGTTYPTLEEIFQNSNDARWKDVVVPFFKPFDIDMDNNAEFETLMRCSRD
jgi:hypothetical protein